jgi:hypothetical protein
VLATAPPPPPPPPPFGVAGGVGGLGRVLLQMGMAYGPPGGGGGGGPGLDLAPGPLGSVVNAPLLHTAARAQIQRPRGWSRSQRQGACLALWRTRRLAAAAKQHELLLGLQMHNRQPA